MAHSAALPILVAERGLTHYLEEIRRFPMLEPQEECMLAKRWHEHGDRAASHKLVTSHLRLVAKIAMSYRDYGLPISEVISEGNVGLMQAVKRFEPEKGFKLATYAMWWIKASIQEYILRSWSLVKMGTTANQKKLFFNLRKAKSKISALQEGDMRSDQVKTIAKRLGVTEQDVVNMNRRLGGDVSLNAPIRNDDESGEWQDWLADDGDTQESVMAEHEELGNRKKALTDALSVLNNRERRIFVVRRLTEDPITLAELADEFAVSRERVRQIEVSAFAKVQKAVKSRVAALEASSLAVTAHSRLVSATSILFFLTALIAGGASGLALATIGSSIAYAETKMSAIGDQPALMQSQDMLNLRIANFKAALRLTAAQERLWLPVESVLRGIARRQVVDEVSEGGMMQRTSERVTEFVLSAAALRRLVLAAQPLVNSLDDEQKRNASTLASNLGFSSVADKFK
jgi:RNA polymerase sigma-32 factor